jgi:hypothetical protein
MSRFNYSQYYIASPGRIWGTQADLLIKPYINGNPGSTEQWSVTIPSSPVANTIYAIIVNGYRIAVDSGATPTQATLKSQLLNAFNAQLAATFTANPAVNSFVTATNGSTAILLLTANKYEEKNLILTEGTGLTASVTTQQVARAGIDFGLIVVAAPNNWHKAMLPQATSDRVLGVTLSPYDIEKDAFGEKGKANFPADEPMDVLVRTNGAEGVWVQSDSSSLVPGDPVYVSIAAETRGKVTKNPTNAINISSFASFQYPSQNVNLNQLIALVRFNVV